MDDMKRRIREEVALQKARLHEQGQRAGPGGAVQGGARPQPGPPGLPDVEAMMRRVRATVAHRKSIERPRPAGGADRNRPAAGESTGGAAASMEKEIKESGIDIVMPRISFKYMPDENDLKKCYDYGREFAGKISV